MIHSSLSLWFFWLILILSNKAFSKFMISMIIIGGNKRLTYMKVHTLNSKYFLSLNDIWKEFFLIPWEQMMTDIQGTVIMKCSRSYWLSNTVLTWGNTHLAIQVFKNHMDRASLVVQWLRICLPMQGTRVRALVWEDPTCRRATKPVSHNYWACVSGACAPQQERLQWWEAHTPWWRVAPTCHN